MVHIVRFIFALLKCSVQAANKCNTAAARLCVVYASLMASAAKTKPKWKRIILPIIKERHYSFTYKGVWKKVLLFNSGRKVPCKLGFRGKCLGERQGLVAVKKSE